MGLSRDTRDAILFWFLLGVIGWETVIDKADKPSLLGLVGVLLLGMGANRDRNRQENGQGGKES